MEEVRWLEEDEQRAWRSFLHATRLLLEQLDRELQQDAHIPHGYYEILVRLSETPDHRLRMSDLANRSVSSRSRLSHAITRLEEAGWVRREVPEGDKRGMLAILTDEGFRALQHAAPGHVRGVRRHVFDQLTPDEVEALGRISTKILDHLRPLEQDRAEGTEADVDCPGDEGPAACC